MTDRKKPGVAFWATVALVVVVLYVASFGPACWIASRTDVIPEVIPTIYRPITWGISQVHHGPLDKAIRWYAQLAAADRYYWWSYIDRDGTLRWLWARI